MYIILQQFKTLRDKKTMGKKFTTDLCDSLLENLFNTNKIVNNNNNTNNNIINTNTNNNNTTTTINNNNDDNNNSNKLTIWKQYRNDPKTVLQMAFKNMTKDQKYFFQLVTNYKEEEEEKKEKECKTNVNNDECTSRRQIYMLAGLPGTGKSFLQTSINLFFKNAGKEVLCLAPTNLIAYQQKGTTIHKMIFSLCQHLDIKHFKCDNDFIQELLKRKYDDICNMSLTQLCNCITTILDEKRCYKNNFCPILSKDIVILIDEGTMVSSTLFSLLYYTYPNATYVIMYGPNQLPPPVCVKGVNIPSCDECIVREEEEEEEEKEKIFFYELTSQMRFNNNNSIFIEFVQYFSDVLSGKMAGETTIDKLDKIEYFFKNLTYGGNLKDYRNLTGDSKRVLIVTTNEQRCQENNERLQNEGDGPVYRIPAEKPPELPDSYDLPSRIGIDNVLSVRKGVYCMVRINDLSRKLIKGQIVKIVDLSIDDKNNNAVSNITVYNLDTKETLILSKLEISTDFPCKKNYKNEIITIEEEEEKERENEPVYLTVKQFPITLSYSLTAHSAQGKTLNCNIGIQLKHYRNNVNINSYFVAITRVCDSKQIFMNFHPACLLHYDMNIKSMSDIVRMKNNLYDNDNNSSSSNSSNNNLSFRNYVNNFVKRKFSVFNSNDGEKKNHQLEEESISPTQLQNINDICKKICQLHNNNSSNNNS